MKTKAIFLALLLSLTAGTTVYAETPESNSGERFQALTSWFTQRFKRTPPLPKGPGASRGEEVCLLSPSIDIFDKTLWQQPVFLWRGRIANVGLRQVGADELLWRNSPKFDADALLQSVRYDGPQLESGVLYEWGAFSSASATEPSMFLRFKIINPQEKGPITRAWLHRSIAMQQAGNSPENWTRQKVEFLLEQELAADVYQSLFLAAMQGHLDEEGTAVVQRTIAELCNPTALPRAVERLPGTLIGWHQSQLVAAQQQDR